MRLQNNCKSGAVVIVHKPEHQPACRASHEPHKSGVTRSLGHVSDVPGGLLKSRRLKFNMSMHVWNGEQV